jgi:DNA-binding MarR family transcriptional regulator
MNGDASIRQDAVDPIEACRAYNALVDQIVKTAAALEAAGNESARPAGQTLARSQVLAIVGHEPAPVATIAGKLGYTRQGVQRVADILVKDGLCRYRPNPAHQRAKLLEMTPDGGAALDVIQAANNECARRAAAGIAPTTLEVARQVLNHIQQQLQCNDFPAEPKPG